MAKKNSPGCSCCECIEITEDLPRPCITGWYLSQEWSGNECCKCVTFLPGNNDWQYSCLGEFLSFGYSRETSVNAYALESSKPKVIVSNAAIPSCTATKENCCWGGKVSLGSQTDGSYKQHRWNLLVRTRPDRIDLCVSKQLVECGEEPPALKWVITLEYRFNINAYAIHSFEEEYYRTFDGVHQCATAPDDWFCQDSIPLVCSAEALEEGSIAPYTYGLFGGQRTFRRTKLFDTFPTGSITFENSDVIEPECTTPRVCRRQDYDPSHNSNAFVFQVSTPPAWFNQCSCCYGVVDYEVYQGTGQIPNSCGGQFGCWCDALAIGGVDFFQAIDIGEELCAGQGTCCGCPEGVNDPSFCGTYDFNQTYIPCDDSLGCDPGGWFGTYIVPKLPCNWSIDDCAAIGGSYVLFSKGTCSQGCSISGGFSNFPFCADNRHLPQCQCEFNPFLCARGWGTCIGLAGVDPSTTCNHIFECPPGNVIWSDKKHISTGGELTNMEFNPTCEFTATSYEVNYSPITVNFDCPDTTPLSVNWTAVIYHCDTNEANVTSQQIQNINTPISLLIKPGTGTAPVLYYQISAAEITGSVTGPPPSPWVAVTADTTITIDDDEWLSFTVYDSAPAVGTITRQAEIVNLSDGNRILDVFLYSSVCPDVTPNPTPNWGNIYHDLGTDEQNIVSQQFLGINTTISIQLDIGAGTQPTLYYKITTTDQSSLLPIGAPDGTWVSVTADTTISMENNKWLSFRCYDSTSSGGTRTFSVVNVSDSNTTLDTITYEAF